MINDLESIAGMFLNLVQSAINIFVKYPLLGVPLFIVLLSPFLKLVGAIFGASSLGGMLRKKYYDNNPGGNQK